MAFPTSAAPIATTVSVAATTHTVNIGSPSEGQLLLVVGRVPAGSTFTWPADWNVLKDASQAGTSSDRIGVAYKYLAAGSAEIGQATMSVVVHATTARLGAWLAWKINGADSSTAPQISADATGTTANPNSAALTPTGGIAKDYLVFTVATAEGEQTVPYGTLPTDYSLYSGGASSGTGGSVATNATITGAARELNTGAAIDPGAFTMSAADDWLAWTIIVHPATAQSKTLGIVSSPSTAQPLSFVKPIRKTAGSVSTVDAAVALTYGLSGPITKTLGVVSTANAAQPLVATKPIRKALGVVSTAMAGVALVVTKPLRKSLGSASTGNAAQPITFTKPIRKTLGIVSSANAAVALVARKPINKLLGAVSTVDAAIPASFTKAIHKVLGHATTADVAQPLNVSGPIRRTLGIVSSSNVALPLVHFKPIHKALGVVQSLNTAMSLGSARAFNIGVVTETSEARTLTIVTRLTLGPATTVDVALPITFTGPALTEWPQSTGLKWPFDSGSEWPQAGVGEWNQ